jgi:hypothetical protein
MTISTTSRRQILASIPAAMTPGVAAALSATPEVTGDDPVFNAIERHRPATQALSGGPRAVRRASPAAVARRR